jgi:hypothetical protein
LVLGGRCFQAIFQCTVFTLQLATLRRKLADFRGQLGFFRDNLLMALLQASGALLMVIFGCFN